MFTAAQHDDTPSKSVKIASVMLYEKCVRVVSGTGAGQFVADKRLRFVVTRLFRKSCVCEHLVFWFFCPAPVPDKTANGGMSKKPGKCRPLASPSGRCRLKDAARCRLAYIISRDEDLVRITLSQFLEHLFDEGRVMVSAPEPAPADELSAADATLAALEAVYRLDLPGEPPPLSPPAARWAAVSLFYACQFVAFRNAGEEMIAVALASPVPPAEPASLHYSVDLTFRFLPDLLRLARSDAENDPLLGYLQQWAAAWPLSSVGLPGVTPSSIEPIVRDPCLLSIYCDRVIARNDRSRRSDPRVEDAVRQAVGEEMADAI